MLRKKWSAGIIDWGLIGEVASRGELKIDCFDFVSWKWHLNITLFNSDYKTAINWWTRKALRKPVKSAMMLFLRPNLTCRFQVNYKKIISE